MRRIHEISIAHVTVRVDIGGSPPEYRVALFDHGEIQQPVYFTESRRDAVLAANKMIQEKLHEKASKDRTPRGRRSKLVEV